MQIAAMEPGSRRQKAVQFQESSRLMSGWSASTSYSSLDSSSDWHTQTITAESFSLQQQPQQRHFLLTQHTLSARRCTPRRVQLPGSAPFASLTSLLGDGFRLLGVPWNPKEDPLRQTFDRIDASQKGHIDEEDLVAYAQLQGLPGAYVKPFVAAVRNSRSTSGGSSGEEEEEAPDLTYARFKRFVEGREEGLRHAFGLFDKDKDGTISYDDLDATLAHVAVCCPNSRCVYRTRDCMVRELLQRLGSDYNNNKSITFSQFRQFFVLLPQTDMVVEYWLSATAAGSCCDVGGRVLVQEKRRRGSPWGHLFAGAVAGAASRTATAPLETMRLIAMAGAPAAGMAVAQQAAKPSLVQMAQQMVQAHGWKALYRGNAMNVMRCAPSKALDFFAFDMYKARLGDDKPSKIFAAAGLAGATSWLLLYPLEVLRSRLTLDSAGRYAGPLHCLRLLLQEEGARGLFRGLGPSLAAIAPEAAITYGLHDLLKRSYKRWHHQEPGVGPSLAFGVLSAFSGQLVAYPLETVSRRLQVAAVNSGPQTVQGVVQAVLREGGPAAFYRGVGAATIRLIPMAVVSFGSYEAVRAALLHWELKQDLAEVQARYKQLNRMLQGAGALLQQQQQQQQGQGQGQGQQQRGADSHNLAEADAWNGHLDVLRVDEDGPSQQRGAAAAVGAAAAALEAGAPGVPKRAVAAAQQAAERVVVRTGALQVGGADDGAKDSQCPAVACEAHAPEVKQR